MGHKVVADLLGLVVPELLDVGQELNELVLHAVSSCPKAHHGTHVAKACSDLVLRHHELKVRQVSFCEVLWEKEEGAEKEASEVRRDKGGA